MPDFKLSTRDQKKIFRKGDYLTRRQLKQLYVSHRNIMNSLDTERKINNVFRQDICGNIICYTSMNNQINEFGWTIKLINDENQAIMRNFQPVHFMSDLSQPKKSINISRIKPS